MIIFFAVIVLLIMAVGLAGTILPVIPSVPLIYAGYLLYGLATGWQDYGWTVMIIWGVITVLSVMLDYYAGAIGAKTYGASRAGVWGSVIGAIAGIFVFNVAGLIIGPFVGALAGELIFGRSFRDAFRSGWGALLGFLAGSLFKVVLALAMIGVFLWLIIW